MVTATKFNEWYAEEFENYDGGYYTHPEEIVGERYNSETKSYETAEFSIGKIEIVDQEGGEGQGDHAHIIVKVDGEQYFELDGYYSSYDGFSWDSREWYEVEPATKTVTYYKAKAKS